MSRVLVMGDIHGAHKALVQCLERAKFDKDSDTLIQLGDVADGWPYVYECVEILLKIKNLIAIKGNHDEWFEHWLRYGVHTQEWVHGADATARSYINHAEREISFYPDMGRYITNLTRVDIPKSHEDFWLTQHLYYKDSDNNLFVHGGFNRHYLLSEQPRHIFYWDRDLWSSALVLSPDMGYEGISSDSDKYSFKIKEPLKEIFIGHTSTTNWKTDKPMNARNVWNLDTGAGFSGRLTIMDVATKEYWQSDPVQELYPNDIGRSGGFKPKQAH